jgi:hypothetical protein
MITNNPISFSDWGSFDICRSNLSMKGIVKSLEKTISQVQITDWVNSILEVYASWHLAVSGSPLMLDTFHMPLVDHNYDSLLWAFIDLPE